MNKNRELKIETQKSAKLNDLTDKSRTVRQGEHVQDDNYPGSFFCIPSIPRPGKTSWSLAQ